MAWLPVAAWLVAVLVALVVLGFCGYEIAWKTKRLQRDLGSLTATGEQLQLLRGQLADVQQRLIAADPTSGTV